MSGLGADLLPLKPSNGPVALGVGPLDLQSLATVADRGVLAFRVKPDLSATTLAHPIPPKGISTCEDVATLLHCAC